MPELMTTREVAELLNVSPSTVEDWRHRGGILPRPRKVGPRLVRYVRAEIEQWIEAQAA